MIKLSAISLSLIILMQCFGLSIKDIGQIDELIEHAQMHNQEYGDNIFVFISKHYGELKAAHEKEHQEEKEDHEKLPFKQQSSITAITAFVLVTQKEDFKTQEFSEYKAHPFYYQLTFSSLHSEGLFEPPRLS